MKAKLKLVIEHVYEADLETYAVDTAQEAADIDREQFENDPTLALDMLGGLEDGIEFRLEVVE